MSQPAPRSTSEESGPKGVDDEFVANDDAAIGRAFRWSIAVVAGVAAIGGGIWLIQSREVVAPPPPPVVLDGPVLPERTPEVELPRLIFTDITEAAGIDFVMDSGARGEKLLPETMGGGVAFFDHDGSGFPDLLFVGGRPWEHTGEAPTEPSLRLYRNSGADADGVPRFEDITTEANLAGHHLHGMGVAVGDVDGNGHPDLFVTAVGSDLLLRQVERDGIRRYEDITSEAGVGGESTAWSTGAMFFDLDRDGVLDLVVVEYVQWSREIDFEVDYRLTGLGRAYGPPTNFIGTNNRLYRGNGDGTFDDISESAGFHINHPTTGLPVGKGLAILPVDLDLDGWTDLVVANDTTRNFVFRNITADAGRLAFEEIGLTSGIAFDRNGAATGAMGIDGADHRNDGHLAIGIGNFANEMSSFFVSRSGDSGRRFPFSDDAVNEGIGGPTRLALTFGVAFMDVDLDGRLDFVQANGHIEDEISVVQPSQRYEQPGQLFWNRGDQITPGSGRGAFVELPASLIGDLAMPVVGRGLAYADIDGDGDLDLVITQAHGRPLLLRNDQAQGNHWLRVVLQSTRSAPGAFGAVVEVEAGGVTQRRVVNPTRSYLSQVELPVTFGLGSTSTVDRLTVTWPSGLRQDVPVDGVDRLVEVVEASEDD